MQDQRVIVNDVRLLPWGRVNSVVDGAGGMIAFIIEDGERLVEWEVDIYMDWEVFGFVVMGYWVRLGLLVCVCCCCCCLCFGFFYFILLFRCWFGVVYFIVVVLVLVGVLCYV